MLESEVADFQEKIRDTKRFYTLFSGHQYAVTCAKMRYFFSRMIWLENRLGKEEQNFLTTLFKKLMGRPVG